MPLPWPRVPKHCSSTSRRRASIPRSQGPNEFSALLTRLSDDGVAVLMATHDLFRAKEGGTRVGIMKRGALVAVHGPDEFSHAEDGGAPVAW